MKKQTKYNIKDTNVAGIGSDLDKNIRQAAAKTEPSWEAAGKETGLLVWRIEKFQVVVWPKAEYGKFFSDDSYIVLNTYKKKGSEKLLFDVHFWLGDTTSQDEAGTAAYKTVELDDLLGGEPVQHREVEGFESELFQSYFPNGIKYLEGGVESGFNHVKPTEYRSRLLHIEGKRNNIRVLQVPSKVESLNSGDCFILDAGLVVYQWSGSSAGIAEKSKASQLTRALDDERGSKVKAVVLTEGQDDEDAKAFFALLGGTPNDKIKTAQEGGDDSKVKPIKRLIRLSDASGTLKFTVEEDGTLTRSKLDSKDVFIVDVGAEIFTWVGKSSSKEERRQGLARAQQYLNEQQDRPNYLPITRILEGGENEQFEVHFH